MDSEMNGVCELAAKKVIRKKRTRSIPTLDTSSIKKRLRGHHVNATILDLNDDCLLVIFEKLDKIDLCQAQNVCSRFVPLAEEAFRFNVKRIPSWLIMNVEDTISKTRRIYFKFGHLFESLDVRCYIDSAMLRRLTHLKHLILARAKMDWEMVSAIQSAEHLTLLALFDCKFVSKNTPLNSWELLQKKNLALLRLDFPEKLPPLRFFIKLLQYNQQIRCLGLPIAMPAKHIIHVPKHAKQLNKLIVYTNNSRSTNLLNILSELKDLRYLIIVGSRTTYMSAKPIVDLIKQKIPELTHLELRELVFTKATIETISEIKNLQHLTLIGSFNCLKTELALLVASLPFLINLALTFKHCNSPNCVSRDLQFDVLKRIVEEGKQLNLIKFRHVKELRINEKAYAELIEVLRKGNRKEKLLIEIEGCRSTTSVDVPMYVQRIKCLRIDYSVDEYCICNSGCSRV